MKKSKIIIVILVILVIVGLILGALFLTKKSNKSVTKVAEQKKISEPVNQIPIKERPFNYIYPRADGKEVTIVIDKLNDYHTAEYELEYQAGTLLQGAFGKIEFNREETPVERNILLGSCSAGGKCSYHEDVNGGTLTVRYLDGEVTKLKSEWNFQLMRNQEGKFTSRDAKFTIDLGKNGLASNTYVIITQTMGLPGKVEGDIIGGPYAITFPKGVGLKIKEIQLGIRLSEESSTTKLLGWTENGWLEYESEVDGKTLTATVDKATTYIAVASQTQKNPPEL